MDSVVTAEARDEVFGQGDEEPFFLVGRGGDAKSRMMAVSVAPTKEMSLKSA